MPVDRLDRVFRVDRGVVDLYRAVSGIGHIDVAGRFAEPRDGDAVAVAEAALPDPQWLPADFQRRAGGFVDRDVGAVVDVDVARAGVDRHPGGASGVNHGAWPFDVRGERRVPDHVAVEGVHVEIAGGVDRQAAGTVERVFLFHLEPISEGGFEDVHDVVVVIGDVEISSGVDGEPAGPFESVWRI